ncbi:hypothetical protein CJ030_MR3G014552 [Morella rubra]|uniref:Uncharacterized protein n=1 Tax=Morella rubra TaxID=262757 RepID=A0A6A1W2P3_9ROSI|nr:hypothetical protein CJ030_MR3G014552 [Morella rubra]
MDEEKDKDVCLGSVSESTTVNVREHVAGETQVEGSLSVGVERVEDGGGCNGDDIMVEVLGSDVYVDGVCTHGEGGRGGLAEDEIGGSGDGKSVEGDGKSLVRNGGRSALSLRGIGVSGGEASNLQSKTGVDCSLGMVESPGKQARVVKAEKVEVTMREGGSIGERLVGGEGQKETVGTGRRNDDLTRQDVTCLDGEALNTAIGAGDGGSLAVTVSMCVETHDVHVEEVVVVAGEAVLEKEMVEVGAERGREVIGGGSDGIEGTNTKEVVVFDDKEKTTRLENGVGDSSVVVGSLGVETQVVKEVGMTETVEGLESGLIVDGAEDGRELAYVGLDVANNLSKQEVGVGDEVWNPGIDSKAASTELVVEKSSLQAQDYKEKVPVVVTEEMNPKIVTSGSCALEGVVCNSGREQSSITELLLEEQKRMLQAPNRWMKKAKLLLLGKLQR